MWCEPGEYSSPQKVVRTPEMHLFGEFGEPATRTKKKKKITNQARGSDSDPGKRISTHTPRKTDCSLFHTGRVLSFVPIKLHGALLRRSVMHGRHPRRVQRETRPQTWQANLTLRSRNMNRPSRKSTRAKEARCTTFEQGLFHSQLFL